MSRPNLISSAAMALFMSACGGEEATPTEARAPRITENASATRVEVAVVHMSTAGLQARWPGEVVGSQDALLAAAMGGFVERVQVEEGERVEEGQVLVRVDTASAGARVGQARVEVEAATRELARAERLGGAISVQQVDTARSRVAAARAGLRSATVASSRSIIRAPFAGTIAQVSVERGEVAAPGAPLVRLVRLSPVHVAMSVPDRDVGALRAGMSVKVRADATSVPIDGRILRISPAADLRTRAFEVRVVLPNEDRALLPGMIADVEVQGETAEEAVVIPQYTLVTALRENGVFVAEGNLAHWRPVQVERVLRDQVVIASGVSVNDRLIVTGHRELAEGDQILTVREGVCCTQGRVVFGEEADAAGVEETEPSEEAAP
ncbi:MAG: membrane fusion protein (multidrug efflux system) [Polyangiales bacterium]|jgi:membrane fusion protein (multidrug efflux system)